MAAAALAIPAAAHAQQAPPSYAGYTTTVFIPFTDPASQLTWTGPVHVAFTIRGKLFTPTMDTGSTGVMIDSRLIPNYTPSAADSSGWEFLTSSKLLFTGHWVPEQLVFHTRTHSATASVRVLAVDSVRYCPGFSTSAGTCPDTTSSKATRDRGTVYMGVGFGREYNGQPQGTPDKNPFLNVTSIDGRPVRSGDVRPGYVVTRRGVYLGLTAANTRGFVYERLTPYSPVPMDWSEADECLQVDNSACVPGKALVDTGIDQMYLTVTEQMPVHTVPRRQGPPILADGSRVTVRFTGTDPVASYTFTLGVPNSMAPTFAVPRITDGTVTFVNTGRHFLRGYDVLFDGAAQSENGGWFGLRRVPLPQRRAEAHTRAHAAGGTRP
jgi:hypothetical protein